RALELAQRLERAWKPLRDVGAVEQHRVVARKVRAVVREYWQAVLVELRVGRVNVDRVDLLAGDRFVGEAMIEAARRFERKRVRLCEAGASVVAVDELLR